MTEDRFIELVEAYGADPNRWPEADRAGAAELAAARPDLAQGCLEAARRLDHILSADLTRAPSHALRRGVIEAAPRQRAVGRVMRWIVGAGLGLGLAASCAAGVAAGMSFAPPSVTGLIGQPAGGEDVSSLADPVGDAGNG